MYVHSDVKMIKILENWCLKKFMRSFGRNLLFKAFFQISHGIFIDEIRIRIRITKSPRVARRGGWSGLELTDYIRFWITMFNLCLNFEPVN